MTRFGATLADVPARVPWTALRSFARHLDESSALVREMSPDAAEWRTGRRVPAMLADIFDALSLLRWEFECANTPKRKRRPRRPDPYPRPGAKGNGRRIGSDPIRIRDFDDWWEGGAHGQGRCRQGVG